MGGMNTKNKYTTTLLLTPHKQHTHTHLPNHNNHHTAHQNNLTNHTSTTKHNHIKTTTQLPPTAQPPPTTAAPHNYNYTTPTNHNQQPPKPPNNNTTTSDDHTFTNIHTNHLLRSRQRWQLWPQSGSPCLNFPVSILHILLAVRVVWCLWLLCCGGDCVCSVVVVEVWLWCDSVLSDKRSRK